MAVEARICSLSIEAREVETRAERYGAVRTRKECVEESARVRTMYKRKDKKVNPVDAPLPNGVNPGGGAIRRGSKSEEGEKHAGKTVQRGSRLTPERLEKMRIGDGFLSDSEKQMFINILFEYEGAIAFTDDEMGLLGPSIEPAVIVHTVPHTPWQQQNL
jgi:hypothetical protein